MFLVLTAYALHFVQMPNLTWNTCHIFVLFIVALQVGEVEGRLEALAKKVSMPGYADKTPDAVKVRTLCLVLPCGLEGNFGIFHCSSLYLSILLGCHGLVWL